MRRLPLPLAVFLTFQGLFALTASGRVDRVADEFEVYLQVESLWERGTLAIDQVPDAIFFGARGKDGHRYAPYGPGAAFTALPHHVLGRGLVSVLGLDREQDPASFVELLATVTSLSTSTWAALAVLGVFVCIRELGGSERRALAVSGLLGLGSFLWPFGTFFYSEPVAAALAVWAVAWHLKGWPWVAGACLFALAMVKATHASAAAGLLVVAALDPAQRQNAARYCMAIAAAACQHSGYNWIRFGDLFDFGYRWTESGLFGLGPAGEPAEPQPFALSRLPVGLVGLLASPGKSILLFVPGLVLLADPERWRAWRGSRWVYTLALGGLGVGLLFFGSYFFWEGGYAFGPRHLLPAAPLGLLPLARAPLRGYRVALMVGLAVGLLGASTPFLEDQGLGEDVSRPREVYYRIDPQAAPGAPKNVYRLDYMPWARAASRLGSGLAAVFTADDPTQVEPQAKGPTWIGTHLRALRAEKGLNHPSWLPLGFQGIAWLLLGLGGLTIASTGRKRSLIPAPSGIQRDTGIVS